MVLYGCYTQQSISDVFYYPCEEDKAPLVQTKLYQFRDFCDLFSLEFRHLNILHISTSRITNLVSETEQHV